MGKDRDCRRRDLLTYIYLDSYVNGKPASELTDMEKMEFERRWVHLNGGKVIWVNKRSGR